MSVRAGYEQLGGDGYYKEHAEDYVNPHIKEIEYLLNTDSAKASVGNTVLDLCCGGGEVTNILLKNNTYVIDGVDPYTAAAYKKNTGRDCLNYDFKSIVQGSLQDKRYDTIICSFAMHLCEESMLNSLLYQLRLIANTLIIITPHKRPDIKSWWNMVEEIKYNKVKLRIYK